MKEQRLNYFQIFLYIALIGLSVEVFLLIRQNRELKSQLEYFTKGPETLKAGEKIEAMNVLDLEGNQKMIALENTGKKTLLFVFTTTCPSCAKNLPYWRDIISVVDGAKTEILGISTHDIGQTKAYQREHDLSWPVTSTTDSTFIKKYKVNAVPQTILIDEHGKVQQVWLGLLTVEQVKQIKKMIS